MVPSFHNAKEPSAYNGDYGRIKAELEDNYKLLKNDLPATQEFLEVIEKFVKKYKGDI